VLDEAMTLAAKLTRTVAAGRYAVGSIEVSLRAHVGIAVSPWHGHEIADLVRYSAFAAERANDFGQAVTVYDRTERRLTQDDLALLADLRTAADDGQLWLAYQPQMAAGTGHAVGVESLLRWNHPTRGFVSPGEFIPLAERTGLIDRLTEWVLDQALDAQVRWRALGFEVPVSVNVSARSLTRPDLSALILEALRSRELPTSALTVEVTETAATPDLLLAINLLRPLHDNGVRISIDDFGTGYTSLSVLPSLPLDELKVDQQFVMRSATSSADEAIVRSVRELAHRLGLTAVAEGVEDEALDRRIVALGFDVIQGYFHARPMPEDALLDFLRDHTLRADRALT
jgi:EAL domain-containing protein (putative c-di-GMP-specific phosphodiesterase class I)